VIFFRDQDITPAQQLGFAKRFGDPVPYPMIEGIDGFPEIAPVIKLEHETVNFGGVWHTDTIYTDEPPMGAILAARELPEFGGDTIFANMYAAYEALSDGLKAMLGPLRAVNSSAKGAAQVTRLRGDEEGPGKDAASLREAVHPVIRTHPETGRKVLYVSRGHTTRFEGMTEDESAPLLDYLFEHQIRPEFTCRFRWAPGSIAFWDNRAAQHYPINDYHGHKRIMHRISIAGDKPY
jgi:taurine dioxygenase